MPDESDQEIVTDPDPNYCRMRTHENARLCQCLHAVLLARLRREVPVVRLRRIRGGPAAASAETASTMQRMPVRTHPDGLPRVPRHGRDAARPSVTVPTELDATLHRLWTRAVGTPEYDKEEWKSLERGIYALGRTAERDEVLSLLRECADACDELRNTLSHSLPACVTRARALLDLTPECTCGEWTEENPVTCPRHDTPEEAERVRQLLLATAQRVRSEKLKRGEVECGAKDPAGWGGTCSHPPHGTEREHQYQSTRRAKPSDVTHILEEGQALCRFTTALPGAWPHGNYWVRMSESKEATCPVCRLAEAEGYLREVLRGGVVSKQVENFLTPSGEAAEQTGEAAVEPSEGNRGDAHGATGGEASASPARDAYDQGWADCVKGVEMTRDTFRRGSASRVVCDVVLDDLRKLAALPRDGS